MDANLGEQFFAFTLSLLIPAVLWHFWDRVMPDKQPLQAYLLWLGRGLALPVLVWGIMNAGLGSFFPAWMRWSAEPEMGIIGRFFAVWRPLLPSILLATICWGLVTLGWIFGEYWREGESPPVVGGTLFLGTLLVAPILWLVFRSFGWTAAGVLVVGVAALYAHWILPAPRSVELPWISYDRAEANMKFGRFHAAELEVIQQLESRPEDYEGWMRLAELYARQHKDLEVADQTIHELCRQPNLTGFQIALALNRLADWHLEIDANPSAARRALHEIVRLLPASPSARMAARRLESLPATREELERQKHRTIRLPGNPETGPPAPPPPPKPSPASHRLTQLQHRLEAEPSNHALHLEYARTLACEENRVDLAEAEIQRMIESPDIPAEHIAALLHQLAGWQAHLDHNLSAARQSLRKIIERFPQSTHAFAAQQRLNLIEYESHSQT